MNKYFILAALLSLVATFATLFYAASVNLNVLVFSLISVIAFMICGAEKYKDQSTFLALFIATMWILYAAIDQILGMLNSTTSYLSVIYLTTGSFGLFAVRKSK